MINKYRIKMAPRRLYNVRNPHKRGGGKIKREHCSNLNYHIIQQRSIYYHLSSSDRKSTNINVFYLCLVNVQPNTNHCPICQDLILRPIFYKFIILGSLDQDPIPLRLGPQIMTLHISFVFPYKFLFNYFATLIQRGKNQNFFHMENIY